MKVLFVISAIVSVASAGVGPIVIIPSSSALLRSPQRDSAIVQSERLGGNFAYAIAEGQNFQRVSPLIASNIRAYDNLGVSYALNPFPILTAPAAILLHQPTSEEEQREQQKQKDLLQKQRDEIQGALDRQREEEERQLREQIDQQNELNQQALEQQKQLIALQQQYQQDQQNLLSGGVVSLPVVPIDSAPVAVSPVAVNPVAVNPINPGIPVNPINPGIPVNPIDQGIAVNPVGPINPNPINQVINNQNLSDSEQGITVSDDSVIVENTSLSKDSNNDGNQSVEENESDRSAGGKSEPDDN